VNIYKLKEKDVDFTIDCLPEYIPVRGYALASGDPIFDKKVEDKILADLEWNEWAWCCIRVTASWGKFTGMDHLGTCCYLSKQDFIDCDDYYLDMKACALNNLNKNIQDYAEQIASLIDKEN
jgi:hypothetical protein